MIGIFRDGETVRIIRGDENLWSRSSFSFISLRLTADLSSSSPDAVGERLLSKIYFDLKATAIEHRETDDVNNEEDGVLKEMVKLFKGENIGLLRVGSGSKNDKFVGLDELFQVDCFFKLNRFIENLAVNWQGASILTDLRQCDSARVRQGDPATPKPWYQPRDLPGRRLGQHWRCRNPGGRRWIVYSTLINIMAYRWNSARTTVLCCCKKQGVKSKNALNGLRSKLCFPSIDRTLKSISRWLIILWRTAFLLRQLLLFLLNQKRTCYRYVS